MTVIAAERIGKSFEDRAILSNVSFSCEAGKTLVIMGGSGSGKTTLLKIVAGLLEPEDGALTIRGRLDDVVFSYMPQGDSLLPWLTVEENILVPLNVGSQQRSITDADRERIYSLLERFGIQASNNQRPSQLSGGMRQRVALARSLLLCPDLLLLDEPFSALDERVRHKIEGDVRGFVRENDIGCLFVTHSVDQALAMGDRIAFLDGTPATLEILCEVSEAERPLPPEQYGNLRAAILEKIHAN